MKYIFCFLAGALVSALISPNNKETVIHVGAADLSDIPDEVKQQMAKALAF